MLYAAKCYWPGVTAADLDQVADLVLCLFQGPSRAAVIAASDQLGIPCERLMDLAWLGPYRRSPDGTQK